MSITYMKFRPWWVRWIRKQKLSPHKYKGETDYIRSQCLVAILKAIEPLYNKLHQLSYKFGVDKINNSTSAIHRDEFKKEVIFPNPVFSKNQAAEIKSKWWTYLFLIIFFGVAETFLYVLTASTFMPQSSHAVKILVGAVFAIGSMFCLGYCFTIKKKYLEACDRFKATEITENDLKWYRNKLNYSYALTVGCILAVLIAGLSRVFYFENIDHAGLTDAEYHSKVIATKLASLFTLIIMLSISIYMGFIKQKFSKTNVDFWHYVNWNKTYGGRNDNTHEFIKYAKSLLFIAEKNAHTYWQYVISIKRIFLEAEYDAKYEQLHEEYWILRCQPQFAVNDEVYRKYSVIQSAYEELFVYGIQNAHEVVGKIYEAAEMMKIPKEHVAEHIKAIEDTMTRQRKPAPVLNGYPKNNSISNMQNLSFVKQLVCIIAFFALASLVSCEKKETRIPKNDVVSIDMSGSRNDTIFSWYKQIVNEKIILGAWVSDRIVTLPVDSGSLQAGQEILIYDFGLNNYTNESAGQDQDKVQRRLHRDSAIAVQQRFSIAFDSALSNRELLNGGTDIIGALETAKKYYLPDHDNIMIELCDMLIYSNYGYGLVDFEHKMNDTPEIEGYLAKIPKIDLRNWKIIVLTGSQPHISAAKYIAVRTFWERYILSCGGKLVDYSSGSVSQLENVIGK